MASNQGKFCHICASASHLALNCPDQIYTRCPTCKNACFPTKINNGHKNGCGNVTFLSKFKNEFESVAEIKPFLELELYSVDDVVIRVGNTFKRFGTYPLWLPEHSLQVAMHGNRLQFDGDKTKSYTIGIMDKAGNRRIKLFTSNVIILNERYICDGQGNVKYGMFTPDASFGYVDCIVQVDNSNDNVVKVRAKWNGLDLLINGYAGGAILVDPFERHLRTAIPSVEANAAAKEHGSNFDGTVSSRKIGKLLYVDCF